MADYGSVAAYKGSVSGNYLNIVAAPGGPPTGPAGGDLAGTYPNPALVANGVIAGTYGDATTVAQLTIDATGRVSTALDVPIAFPTASRANYSYNNNSQKHASTAIGTEYKFVPPSGGITQSLGTSADWLLDNAAHRFTYIGTAPTVFNINWVISATFTESVVGSVTTRFYLKLNGAVITPADIRLSTARALTYSNSYNFGLLLSTNDYIEPYYVGASATAIIVIRNFSFTATEF